MSLLYHSESDVNHHEIRDNLYYKKYHYKAIITIPRGSWIKKRLMSEKEDFVQHMKKIIFSDKSLYIINNNPTMYDNWWDWWNNLSTDDVAVRSENRITSVYSNDLSLLKTLSTVDKYVSITKAIVPQKQTGIRWCRREPKYKYRAYFTGGRYEREKYKKLVDFLKKNKDIIHISQGLQRSWRYHYVDDSYYHHLPLVWTSKSYYVEYDDAKIEFWLQLSWDDFFNKYFEMKKWENTESQDDENVK